MIRFTIATAISGLSLIALHYFPWQRLIRRKLHRLEAYVIGVVAITAGFGAAWSAVPGGNPILLLLASEAAGGFATAACYGIDWLLELKAERDDWRDRANATTRPDRGD